MVETFLESQNLLDIEDYGIHICGDPSSPTTLYLVLDLYCREVPIVDLSNLELQVFKVSKNNTLCVISFSCRTKLSQNNLVLSKILVRMLARGLMNVLLH